MTGCNGQAEEPDPQAVTFRQLIASGLLPLGPFAVRGPLHRIAARYAWALPATAVVGFLASLFETIGVGLLIPLVGLFLGDSAPIGMPAPLGSVADAATSMGPHARFLLLGGTILLLFLLKSALQIANAYMIEAVTGRVGHDIRNALAERLLGQEYAFFLRQDEARLVDTIARASWSAADSMRWFLQQLPAGVGIVVIVGFLAWIDWRLTAMAIAGGGLIFLLLRARAPQLRAASRLVRERNQQLGARMLTIIRGIRPITVFGQQRREATLFDEASETVRAVTLETGKLTATTGPVTELLIVVLFIALLAASFELGLAIATVTAFLVILTRAQPHARTIAEAHAGIAAVRGSVQEVAWLLEQHTPAQHEDGLPVPAGAAGKAIRFEGVTYAYPNASVALHEAGFAIKPGLATALIGRSGAGKSTVVAIVCGLLQPSSGRVMLGDTPLGDIDAQAWRTRLAVAGQDLFLTAGTVRENIVYGTPDATEEDVLAAADAAGASEFIARLPEGYDTQVGPNGLNLSEGQKQRLGLARALIRQPDWLILDEATSAVDAMTEREIVDLLTERRFFRSAIVISHRRSTLAACEDGIVLAHGRVVETGPLRDLAYFATMGDEA